MFHSKGGVASRSQLFDCLFSVKAHIKAKAHAARWKKYSLKQSTLQDTSQQGQLSLAVPMEAVSSLLAVRAHRCS